MLTIMNHFANELWIFHAVEGVKLGGSDTTCRRIDICSEFDAVNGLKSRARSNIGNRGERLRSNLLLSQATGTLNLMKESPRRKRFRGSILFAL